MALLGLLYIFQELTEQTLKKNLLTFVKCNWHDLTLCLICRKDWFRFIKFAFLKDIDLRLSTFSSFLMFPKLLHFSAVRYFPCAFWIMYSCTIFPCSIGTMVQLVSPSYSSQFLGTYGSISFTTKKTLSRCSVIVASSYPYFTLFLTMKWCYFFQALCTNKLYMLPEPSF